NRDGGKLASNADLNIRAGVLENKEGEVLHAGSGHLDLYAANLQGQQGHIASNGTLNLRGTTTDLQQATTQAQTISVETGTLNTARGTLLATGGDALVLKAQDSIDNRDGMIIGNGHVQVQAGALHNQGGTVSSAETVRMDGQESLNNQGGKVLGVADVFIAAGTVDNREGGLPGSTDGGMEVRTQGRTENANGIVQGAAA